MKRCPQCGFMHAHRDVICVRCGTRLNQADVIDPLGTDAPDPVGLQPLAARPIRNLLLNLLGRVGRRLYVLRVRLADPLPENIHRRDPWLAGALALFPGGGQLYNRQPRKALFVLGLVGLCCLAAALTFRHPVSNYVLLASLLALVWSFHDALVTAKRINHDLIVWRHVAGFYCAWIFYIGLFCILAQFVSGIFLIKFRHITHDEMRPWLRRGERVALDRWTYLLRRPQVGDVVYVTNYNAEHPRVLKLEKPGAVNSDVILVRPRNHIERIVALPGETFERRDGVFYRAGRPASPDEQPLIRSQIPWNFKLTAPPDRYLVLMTYTGSDFDPGMTAVSGTAEFSAPRMNTGDWIAVNWEEVNAVPAAEIHARLWFVYNPPPARRWLR